MPANFRTRSEIEKIVDDLDYELLDEYIDENHDRKVIIKDKLGYKYDILLYSLIKNKSGGFVNKSNPYTLENISLWLKLNGKDFELCENNQYQGRDNKLKFYHSLCDEYFYMNWHNVSQGQNCAVCRGAQVGEKTSLAYLRNDLIREYLYSEHNKNPEDITEFSHEYVYWQCLFCGHKWWSSVLNRSMGANCPACANERKESKIAFFCKKYFKNNYKMEPEYNLFKNPENNHWLKCDIYIYDNIFIEIHGEQHYKINTWHKLLAKKKDITIEKEFEYRQHLDQIKKQYCQEQGLYIEVDLRKIKTSEQAIEYIENMINEFQEK